MFRVLLLAASLLAVSGAATADVIHVETEVRQRLSQGVAADRVRDGQYVPMLRVIGDARRRYPNLREVQDAYLVEGSRPHYVVRIITANGVVKELHYDARTGRYLYER